MALTDVKCRSTKPGEKRLKLSDGHGLQLWIQPNGSRLWQIAYRYRGKQRQLSLGPYPEVSLSEARQKRTDIRGMLRDGQDPGASIRASKLPAGADSFKAMADAYIAKRRREGLAQTTLDKKQWLLDMASECFGAEPIASIKPITVLKALRVVEDKGNFETARRLRATIGQVFRYAIASTLTEIDPTAGLKGAITTPVVRHRAAITDAAQFGGLLRAIDGFQGQPATQAALKLMPLLFPRPGELRCAEWSEFDWDATVWTIPASRTKMRAMHRVPLARQALAILQDMKAVSGSGTLVFPAIGPKGRPLSENTLNGALRRLGYSMEDMTAHGFRASASTLLNEAGRWSADAIERQLAHADRDQIRRIYARGEYWDERVAMMQWWADRCDALKAVTAPVKDTGASVKTRKRHVVA